MANSQNLLESLIKNGNWEVAFKTFGNNHNTLIGLIVEWWTLSYPNRYALEPGISYRQGVKGAGRCDAILVENHTPKGIVEVQGVRTYRKAIERMENYFNPNSRDKIYNKLEFGILLVYPTEPSLEGRIFGDPKIPENNILQSIKDFSQRYNKTLLTLILLILEKKFEKNCPEIRRRNTFLQISPIKIKGYLIRNTKNGVEIAYEER